MLPYTPSQLGPFLILGGILVLAITELAVLYRPELRMTGSLFGLLFAIIGLRLVFTDSMLSALPTGPQLFASLLLQVVIGLVIYLGVYYLMQRILPYIEQRYDPPFPQTEHE